MAETQVALQEAGINTQEALRARDEEPATLAG
jgi:hypothetical protein